MLLDSALRTIVIADLTVTGQLKNPSGTKSGEFINMLGYLNFMAPEVVSGDNYGRSSDIWSYACCIIQMGSAQLPWAECGKTGLALLQKVIFNQIRLISDKNNTYISH